MKIAICGSMSCAEEMLYFAGRLRERGHTIFLPVGTRTYAGMYGKDIDKIDKEEGALRKIELDLIIARYDVIQKSDAILVVNCDKDGIPNYIGGNTLMELGFAHVLKKSIFLLHDIPDTSWNRQEIIAVRPTVIHGNLDLIQ